MEENSDQQPRMMHFCKVCNKGFSCGGALGGHMRAHGTEEHSTSEFRDKTEGNKRTYFLRTTTNRFVSHRSREDCGKSFLSGKYSMDDPAGDTRSFNSSTIKGKSTCASSEERELASCLVMLSNGEAIGDSFPLAGNEGAKGNFQCKNCKKVFNSHQALGGHRASHKKVKGCFAARFDIVDADDGDGDDIDVDDDPTLPPTINVKRKSETPLSSPSKRKLKEHKCSICHRVFLSGQALGGHKREKEDISGIQERSYCSLHDGNSEEYNSKVEIAKIGELREMNFDGECSKWLQVGIAPATNGGTDS
ncbi:C2H2-type zinc finger family protein [Actinidia rufa]|uniref:C2H2-type zinc finger family protein n=1 Tax=Actinidia rufa TaxID=165716 RepID=A0A7J0FRW7_9ERIC|nr:C2H2-type zinc finger family protein [Actinidia rufa]